MEDYEYKSFSELQEENKKINQLKEMYHEKMLNFRMAYLKQQNRINEAIEYINKRKYKGYNFGNEMTGSEINHLLDILKGVE